MKHSSLIPQPIFRLKLFYKTYVFCSIESDRWALRIEEAKLSDEGGYECQVTTTNKTILIVYLTVLGKLACLITCHAT